MDSIRDVRLGLEKGEVYPEFDDIKDKHFDYISGDETTAISLNKLIFGRLDAYYQDSNVVQYYSTKMGINRQIKKQRS